MIFSLIEYHLIQKTVPAQQNIMLIPLVFISSKSKGAGRCSTENQLGEPGASVAAAASAGLGLILVNRSLIYVPFNSISSCLNGNSSP